MVKYKEKQISAFVKEVNHTRIQKIQNKLNGERLGTDQPRLKMDHIVDMALDYYWDNFGKNL